MSFVPSAAAQATATLAGANQAGLASPLTALQTSIAGGNLAPAALLDAILSKVGYQAQDVQAASSTSTTSTSFTGNYVWPTWTTPTIAVAGTYLLTVDLTNFYISTAGGFNSISFQVEVNGVAQTQSYNSLVVGMNINTRVATFTIRTPISLNASTNTLKLMWKVDTNTITANVDGFCSRAFTITG